MNKINTKVMLYAYSNLMDVAEQIDDIIERKAVVSMWDCTPAMEQYLKIIELKHQKAIMIELSKKLKIVIDRLEIDEMKILEYRYFKKKKKDYFIGFDCSSRNYYRKHDMLIKRIGEYVDYIGLTDTYFLEHLSSIDFFKDLTRIVKADERKNMKNKSIKKIEDNFSSKESFIFSKELNQADFNRDISRYVVREKNLA